MKIHGKKLKHEYNFEYGNLYFYEDLIIGEVHEGIHVSSDLLKSFFDFFLEHYNEPFGYISYRKNSYSIDPKIYSLIPENSLLKGIAIVSDQKFSSLNAHVEKVLHKGHFELFTTIDAAVNWLDTITTLNDDNISDTQ